MKFKKEFNDADKLISTDDSVKEYDNFRKELDKLTLTNNQVNIDLTRFRDPKKDIKDDHKKLTMKS